MKALDIDMAVSVAGVAFVIAAFALIGIGVLGHVDVRDAVMVGGFIVLPTKGVAFSRWIELLNTGKKGDGK